MDVLYIAGIVVCTGLCVALIALCARLSQIRQVSAHAVPIAPTPARDGAETRP